jgi:hypothetical protein
MPLDSFGITQINNSTRNSTEYKTAPIKDSLEMNKLKFYFLKKAEIFVQRQSKMPKLQHLLQFTTGCAVQSNRAV